MLYPSARLNPESLIGIRMTIKQLKELLLINNIVEEVASGPAGAIIFCSAFRFFWEISFSMNSYS